MVEIPYCEESEKFFQIGNYIENKKNSNTISCYRKKTFPPYLKYTTLYVTVMKIMPVKPNEIPKQNDRNITTQSANQNQTDIF